MRSQDTRKIEDWMKKVANNQNPSTKLVWDPKKKKLVAKPLNEFTPDDNIEFDAEEATRFSLQYLKDQ